MAIDALVSGRLHGAPTQRTTKTGRAYATARLAVTDASGAQHLVSMIAFSDDVVRRLLALADGDSVAVAGELSIGTYTTKTSEIKPALRLLVHAILTPYHVKRRRDAAAPDGAPGRPRGARTAPDGRRHAAALRAQQPLPDDDLPL